MSRTTAVTEPHVVALAFPFGNHASPLFSIINKLAKFSSNTQFSFLCAQKAQKIILSIYKIQPNVKVCDFWEGVPKDHIFTGKYESEEVELFMKEAPRCLRNEINAAVADTGREVTCLMSDALLCWFTAELAAEMTVPYVACWICSAASLSVHFYTDFIRETFGVGGEARNDETLTVIPGMSKVQIGDLPEGVLFGDLESLFSEILRKMAMTAAKADAVSMNSFEELEPIITNDLKSKFKKLLCTGPSILLSPPSAVQADTYGCIPWLHKQKPASVAYIAFGTAARPAPHEFSALAEALEETKVPFIWSLEDHAKAHLPKGFMDKTKSQGLVVPWTPQMEVLAHTAVGVFVTQGGWISIMESIQGGVPMICTPIFAEQWLNARMVQDVWEVGVKVEGGVLTKNGVVECLNQILWQEKGKKMRENIRVIEELAERATAPEGGSYRNFIALAELVTGAAKNNCQSVDFSECSRTS